MEGVSLPSTLAMQEQLQQITNGRDLFDQGEPLPEQWNIPVPKLLVRNDLGQTFAVEGSEAGIRLQPYVPGTPSTDGAEPPEPEQDKKPESPDFCDRQAGMLVERVKDMGKDVLKAGLMAAFNNPSVGGFFDGCLGKGQDYWETLLSPDKMMSVGIGEATGLLTSELMNLWAVDDKSSAAEQISRQLVSQYLAEAVRQKLAAQLEELLSLKLDKEGPSKVALIQSAFTSAGCFLAAKSTDLTDHSGTVVGAAAKTQIHQLAAVRVTDVHKCGKHPANPVAEGNPTIFIEGLPASRVGHQTVCAAKITPGSGSVFYGPATKAFLSIQEPPAASAPLPASLPPSKPAGAPAPGKPVPAAKDGKPNTESNGEIDPNGESEPSDTDEIKIASSKKDEEDLLKPGPDDLPLEELTPEMKDKLKELDPNIPDEVLNDINQLNSYLKKALKGLNYAEVLTGPMGKAYKLYSTLNKGITAAKIANGGSALYDTLKTVIKISVSQTTGAAVGGFGGGLCAASGVGTLFTPACAAGGYIVGAALGESAVDKVFEGVEQLPTNASYIWQYLTTPVDPYRVHVYTDWSNDPPTAGDSLADAMRKSQ